MIYKVGIAGASGRMGTEVAALLGSGYELGRDLFELSDAVSATAKLTSVEGVPVRTFDDEAREPVHGWIDFSRPAGTLRLLEKTDAPVVVATTGFSPAELAAIEKAAARVPVLLAPNTSPGVRLFLRLLRALPKNGSPFTIAVEETHHARKVDAPSGTAKALVAALAERGYEPKTVESLRLGGVPGEHRVRFVAEDEEFSLEHHVWNRRVFAKGAIECLGWLLRHKEPRLYRLEEMEE